MPSGDALAVVLANLTQALQGLDAHFYIIAAVLGFVLIGFGLFRLKQTSQTREGTLAGLSQIAIGILLFGFESFVSAASLSLFEEEAKLSTQLSRLQDTGLMTAYIRFAVTIVVLLGIISMMRGLIKLRAASLGREECLWSGLTHLLAGVVCVNIVTFAKIFGLTAGGVVQDVIEKLFS